MKHILTLILVFMLSEGALAVAAPPWVVNTSNGGAPAVSVQAHCQALVSQVQDKEKEEEPAPQPGEPTDISC